MHATFGHSSWLLFAYLITMMRAHSCSCHTHVHGGRTFLKTLGNILLGVEGDELKGSYMHTEKVLCGEAPADHEFELNIKELACGLS